MYSFHFRTFKGKTRPSRPPLAFGPCLALVEEDHWMEGHVLAGPWGASACRDGFGQRESPGVRAGPPVPSPGLSVRPPPAPPQRGGQAGQEPRPAFPESRAERGGLTFRLAFCFSDIPETVPLSTVNRQCSSGLQAVASIAGKL